jgi:serine/threonine protein kinase
MMKIDAGTRLGEYEILEPIGSGGMGSVYLARHVHMGKKYAVKVLPESLAGDENFVARFRDEARVMADLRHPRIVQVHYMGVDGGRYFLAMDYVVGPRKAPMSLQDYFSYRAGRSKRHIDEEVARVWATQVAEAMAHAHERGVVHRDIKPGNVLIDADSNARLTDFGLAKAVGREFMVSQIHNSAGQSLGAQATRAGSRGKNVDDTLGAAATIASGDSGTDASSGGTDGIIGTYDYMAPEQRGEGDGQVDRRSDIYSFGVLLYRMLTGKRPVGMTKAPSQLVPGLSKSWDAIISRCLEEDKDARYQSADELLNELHQIKSARRDRRVAVGLMIACLVVIVTGLVWLFRPGTVNGPSPIPEGPEQVTQSDKPAGFADIIPLKAKADIAWEKVKNVDPRQGFVKMIEEADVVRRSVEAYLLAKDYASAQSACRKLLDKCTTIESLE